MMLSRTALCSTHFIAAGGLATAAVAVTGASYKQQNSHQYFNIAQNEHLAMTASSPSSTDSGGGDVTGGTEKHHPLQIKVSSFLPDSATSLIVPTLEASARVARLVSTAFMVTMDYKTDEWGWATNSAYADEENVSEEQKKQRDYWEKECDRRKEVMEQAQEHYASKYHDNFDLNHELKSEELKEERTKIKRQEKNAMTTAALELAKAEEEFAAVGGVDSKSALHTKAANRMVQLCHKNGGVYIKIGQHLANLDHLIPTEYINAFSALFDENPVTDYERVQKVICQDLGVEETRTRLGGSRFVSSFGSRISHSVCAPVAISHAGRFGWHSRVLQKLGCGDMYHLFAAVLTARPFEDIIERSQQGGSLSHKESTPSAQNHKGGASNSEQHRADTAVIRGYAQRFLNLIFDLVVSLPRPMLLLLKMNDCLRHIDHALGSPTNTVVVTGAFAARAVYEAEAAQQQQQGQNQAQGVMTSNSKS